jgi:hypothetical protein
MDSFLILPRVLLNFAALAREFEHLTPLHAQALFIFGLAIIHTFLAPVLQHRANLVLSKEGPCLKYHLFHYLGEIELCFLFWCIPLTLSMLYHLGSAKTFSYITSRNYTEAAFITTVMLMSATRPIMEQGYWMLGRIVRLRGDKPSSWWLVSLIFGPLLGSLITEPAAMTLCALFLIRQFYAYQPGKALAYGTLGLLFTNISVGGALTSFAAPPVVIVAKAWNLTTPYMLKMYGWKVVFGIVLSTLSYYLLFRRELKEIDEKATTMQLKEEKDELPLPWWISVLYTSLLTAIIYHAHYPKFFLPLLGLTIILHYATKRYQTPFIWRSAILVGLFFVGLVMHGSFQSWWIEIALGGLSKGALLLTSILLTSFNDNAAITYLASFIPDFPESSRYILLAGAITGGGLTVIANAPNPAGQSILGPSYPEGVQPLSLLLGALYPTTIFALLFYLTA